MSRNLSREDRRQNCRTRLFMGLNKNLTSLLVGVIAKRKPMKIVLCSSVQHFDSFIV